MSSITGSCSESPSNLLFEKGIDQVQQRDLEQRLRQRETEVESISPDSSKPLADGLKGGLFDAFA